MCYNIWTYFFKGTTLWVNYGHIIVKFLFIVTHERMDWKGFVNVCGLIEVLF